MKLFLKMLLLAAMASATVSLAEVASGSKDIVVLQPQDLPQAARIAGQSMELHSLGNGKTYLYIEQQQLGRLVILDVTDPARITQVGSVSLETPAVFDFSSPWGIPQPWSVCAIIAGLPFSASKTLRIPRSSRQAPCSRGIKCKKSTSMLC